MESGRIEVLATYPSWAFSFGLVRAKIEIDGSVATSPWGAYVYEVAAGTHTVAVWYQTGKWWPGVRKKVRVEVEPGKTTRVTYRPPTWAFLSAKLTSEDPVPT